MQQKVKLSEVIEAAVTLHQRNRLDEAEALYGKVLEVAPDDTSVLHFYGVLLHQRGRSSEAIDSIERALALDPGYVDAHNNLGNVFKELGRLSEAVAAYRKVLALDENHFGAHNNLGTALRRLDRFDEAIAEYERAIELDPGNAEVQINVGNTLEAADRAEDALTAFRKAIEIKPLNGSAHLNLGRALHFLGRDDEAAIVYRKWLERDPENPVAVHMVAAITGRGAPARASNEYITATFDGFADEFDQKLQRLGYRAPELVADALERALATARETTPAALDLLDAGCGTGLCGPLVRDHARRLVGVDLSRRMLEKANKRGVYDELVHAELTVFLAEGAGAYDAVISADTLIYFGALEQVFENAATALRPGGLLIFSLEHSGDGEAGYRLNAHGRYSHRREYVERALATAGLNVTGIGSEVLRREGRKDVAGLVVTARNRG